MNDPGDWHLDRHIPIALVITIIAQTGGAFWWASAVTNRLDGQERRLALAEQQQAETIKVMTDLRITLAAINAELMANRRSNGTAQ